MRCPRFVFLLLLSLWWAVVSVAGQDFSLRAGLDRLGLGEIADRGNTATRLLFAGGAPLLRDFNATYVPLSPTDAPYPRPETLAWRTLVSLPPMEYQLGEGQVCGAPPPVHVRPAITSCWQRRLLFVRKMEDWAPAYLLVRDDFATLRPPTLANWWIRTRSLWISENRAYAGGQGRAGLDIYIAQPEHPAFTPIDWGNEQQLCVHAAGRNYTFLTVLYPRGTREPAPSISTIAGGQGVLMEIPAEEAAHPALRDYAFLSPTPITYEAGPISFSGRAGLIRLSHEEQIIVLASGGTVTTPGVTIQAGGPVSLRLAGREMRVRTNGAAQLIRLSGTFAAWQVTSGKKTYPALLREGVLSLPVPAGARDFLLTGRTPETRQKSP